MASKNISFDQIPSSIRKPGKYFEFNTKLAVRTLPNNRYRMLIVGQKLSAGTVAALTPTQVFSEAEARDYFGRGSMVHLMAKAAIAANPYLDLTICAMDDAGAGTKGTKTVTITGPATGSGFLRLYVANNVVEIAVTAADTANAIAAALKAELDKWPDLPYVATVVNAVVTLTAQHKGVVGNQVDVSALITASGVTAAIATGVTGATDPDVKTALDVVTPEEYNIVVCPYNESTSLGKVKTYLDFVSGPMEQRPGIAVFGMDDVLGTVTSLTNTVNHGRILCAYLRGTHSIPYEIAAAMAAILAFEEDPARPLNTLELKGLHAPAVTDRFTRTEQESLLYNGVTPLEVGPGERVQVVRAISTYIHDPQGIDDIALLDITTIRTLDYVRKACRERIALRFPREKLSSKTPAKVKSQLLDVLLKLEELEIVEMVLENKDGLVVERDAQDPNRLDAKIPTDVVNGLHVFAGRIDLLL